ncbi:MAG: hypothetical protein GY925_27675 [Actinomycetia bacterium]|nr:hypothetical protein [Actinomycetes bacterium]
MSWRLLSVIAVLLVVAIACASTSPTGPEAIGPEDCTVGMPASDLLGAEVPTIEQTRAHLGLMHELHADTKLLQDYYGIPSQHLMVKGWPRILVATDDATWDCRALLEAVEHPELLVFVDWSEQLYNLAGMPPWQRLIIADIKAASDPSSDEWAYNSMGQGHYDVSRVTLRSDQEPLAAVLLDRYQGLIDIHLGLFPYPPERVDPANNSFCQPVWHSEPANELAVKSMTLIGDTGDGLIELVITNTGATTVHLVPSRTAELTLPAGTELVTTFVGDMTAESRGSIRLDPGADTTIAAIPATEPCNFDLGYALPTGTYEFVLPVQVFDQPAFEGDQSDRALVARLPIDIP